MKNSGNRLFAMLLAGLVVASCTTRSPLQEDSLQQAPALTSRALAPDAIIERVAFASCYVPQFEKPGVWQIISGRQPDLLILMGDNVYQSEEKAEPELLELREAYSQLARETEFAELRAQTPTFATWDDHDYGLNDAGSELSVKHQSERLFEHVWPLPGNVSDPRKGRAGVHHALIIGPVGRRVQVIVLDTRFFRGPLDTPDVSSMLGDDQWGWLAQELSRPAELRLLVSSIPVLSRRQDAENWHRLPQEQVRLLQLLNRSSGVVILSGDSHYAAHYQDDESLSYRLNEFTASSLNLPYPAERHAEVLKHDLLRQDPPFLGANFGWLEIDWATRKVEMSIRSDEGQLAIKTIIDLENLQTAFLADL